MGVKLTDRDNRKLHAYNVDKCMTLCGRISSIHQPDRTVYIAEWWTTDLLERCKSCSRTLKVRNQEGLLEAYMTDL